MLFKYTPTFMPQKVLVVGCGGTGSRLIPLVAQFLKTCGWVLSPEMVVVDDDIVEEKNLTRQNFVTMDVGKPKAQVLAQRYSRAYDIPIVPIMERIESEDWYDSKESNPGRKQYSHSEFYKKLYSWANSKTPVFVVLCVDSAEARRSILTRLTQSLPSNLTVLIDTGNENDFGQVKIGTLAMAAAASLEAYKKAFEKLNPMTPAEIDLPQVPLDLDYYMDMVSSAAPSCADLDQTMAINSLVANTAFAFIQNWYYSKPLTTHKVNVSLSHGCVPEYITSQYLLRCAEHYNAYRYKINMGYAQMDGVFDRILAENRNYESRLKKEELLEKARKEQELAAIEAKKALLQQKKAAKKNGEKVEEEAVNSLGTLKEKEKSVKTPSAKVSKVEVSFPEAETIAA